MVLVIVLAAVLIAVAFELGKQDGASVEAKALAAVLKAEALVSAEFRTVVAGLKAKVSAEVATIKKYL